MNFVHAIWSNYINYYIKSLFNYITPYIISFLGPYWNKIYDNARYMERFSFTLLGCVFGCVVCYISMIVFWMLSFLPLSVRITVITSICTIIASSIIFGGKYIIKNMQKILIDIVMKHPAVIPFLLPLIANFMPGIGLNSFDTNDNIKSDVDNNNNNSIDTNSKNIIKNISIKHGVAGIEYYHNDIKYYVYIPTITNKRTLRHAKTKKVFATYRLKKGVIKRVDITQEDIIPYMVTPSELGCEKVEILNMNAEITATFIGNDKIILTQSRPTLVES